MAMKLFPNPIDSKAIAFQCKIGEKWFMIGYVVSEALDYVHEEMNHNNILNILMSNTLVVIESIHFDRVFTILLYVIIIVHVQSH